MAVFTSVMHNTLVVIASVPLSLATEDFMRFSVAFFLPSSQGTAPRNESLLGVVMRVNHIDMRDCA